MLYWLFKYVLIGPVLWLFGRPTIEGQHHIPKKGPVILAGNHRAVVDSFFLVLMVRRRITFVAKSEYFTGTGVKGAMQRWFFGGAGQVPIDRSGADASRAALDTAIGILDKGGVWGIYPEGTRSPDGCLYKGKTGAIRVALETGAPVIPVVVHGGDAVNPPGTRMWRFSKVRITVGEPIDFSRYRELRGYQAVVRAATDELMTVLCEQSGQEYVDVYGADVKSGDAA
ncbi:1-acyl-sn-glycerol-3-phosphate acyltransferase [Rhodococcus sp. KBW08]|uniref:Lysophospholipid acyltransferase family protein n=1 Tax=Rhodococcus baikonurensis TaxID=172041 RepID=A0ABV5XBX7_9NOCA|nr:MULTISPECIES: lysophospholipid acyltransferase family protein [Rhodococcus]NHP14871.1 1-acyl-sn-glycerol-3-phosphate acyltransferase [Rhodococcus sp. IC4_135]MDI9957719.1 lysophospholipid acyltransferase family protein [Rhodococcus sp. IEGM 1237]MDI9963174.1 lysophospholipid acyltransferase family protein [Rhodococcus sp. IEGM 1251]MDV8124929.1 lysophospholipid acyltransferase family protein [Rhodococcus sp. IEGM 1304]PBI92688.1 1-acyl-sn-glycerol-3-phosphate acyltransferase [Rhodococcus er